MQHRVQVNAFDECLHELFLFGFGSGTIYLYFTKYQQRLFKNPC